MILQDPHLHQKRPQRRSPIPIPHRLRLLILLRLTHAREIDIDPALGLLKPHFGPLLQIVRAGAGEELHARGRVALVGVEVEVHAQRHDGDLLEEVQRHRVRLRPVRLPEGVGCGRAQGGDAAAGFAGRHGPRGEGGDFAEREMCVRWGGVAVWGV